MSRCKVQIIREPGVGDAGQPVDVIMGERKVFDLAPDELKSVFWDQADVRIELRQGYASLLETKVTLPHDHVLSLSMQSVAPRGLFAMFKAAQVHLIEERRKPLPPPEPTLKENITQQMWMGRAESAEALNRVMAERAAYYSEENEEAEGTDAYIELSEFADLMGGAWYDHDFVEYGFAKPGDALETKFEGHSWVGHWAPVVRETVPEAVWLDANAFIMMGHETSGGTPRRQIQAPRDLVADGLSLTYLGDVIHPSG
ncbi:hypothetical protein [Gymnodinialimonas hymeniacidonis]|uniref:hypothetical protein n=1 Tax=Gymnodinialimonas hymeniacidonis TaxID=3126508 RepID=UPI0034C6B41C